MIFYFTGTGNSKRVAVRFSEELETEIVNIADAMRKEEYSYTAEEGETVYFVFPVYFGGLPRMMEDFIKIVKIEGKDVKAAGVATYGSMPNAADRLFRRALKKSGLEFKAFYTVKMVENCIFNLQVPSKESAERILVESEKEIDALVSDIKSGNAESYKSGFMKGVVTNVMQSMFSMMDKTMNFKVEDQCIGCGLCQWVCPQGCITMKDGKPHWKDSKCQHCAACIMRCPVEAIQYGSTTKKKNRYVHPDIKK